MAPTRIGAEVRWRQLEAALCGIGANPPPGGRGPASGGRRRRRRRPAGLSLTLDYCLANWAFVRGAWYAPAAGHYPSPCVPFCSTMSPCSITQESGPAVRIVDRRWAITKLGRPGGSCPSPAGQPASCGCPPTRLPPFVQEMRNRRSLGRENANGAIVYEALAFSPLRRPSSPLLVEEQFFFRNHPAFVRTSGHNASAPKPPANISSRVAPTRTVGLLFSLRSVPA